MQTKKELQQAQTIWLNRLVAEQWKTRYCRLFTGLYQFKPPKIVLNNRLSRTAGRCWQAENQIDLAGKFLDKFPVEMQNIILPHEIAHQIDFNLFGKSEKKCGHGKNWCEIMVKLGLPADKYHTLEL